MVDSAARRLEQFAKEFRVEPDDPLYFMVSVLLELSEKMDRLEGAKVIKEEEASNLFAGAVSEFMSGKLNISFPELSIDYDILADKIAKKIKEG